MEVSFFSKYFLDRLHQNSRLHHINRYQTITLWYLQTIAKFIEITLGDYGKHDKGRSMYSWIEHFTKEHGFSVTKWYKGGK